MNKNQIFKPVIAALFTALVCVATMIIQIPSPVSGYVNMGDCFVLLSGIVLGPVYGFLSAGIGSALSDFLFGYVTYVPGTFLIKGIMALVIALLCKNSKNNITILKSVAYGALSEVIMVVGYFLYECFILKYGIGAIGAAPGNIFQGVCGICANALLIQIINKNIKLKNLLNWRD